MVNKSKKKSDSNKISTKKKLVEISDSEILNDNTRKPKKKGTYDPRNKLNELISTEWIPETVSVWTQKGLGAKHPDTKIEKEHPAPFSFTDVGRLIRFFTKKDQVVLDPFVGIGSTLKACSIDERKGSGFELNKKYVNLTKKRLEDEVNPHLLARQMGTSIAMLEQHYGQTRGKLVAQQITKTSSQRTIPNALVEELYRD